MKQEAEQVLCRFHLSNFTHHHGEPQYEWIVKTARHLGLQGATVLKGFMGLGADGALLEEKPWALSHEVPVIVEVVDAVERIETLLSRIEPAFARGTITLERAHVVLYRSGGAGRMGKPEDVVATKGRSAAGEVRTMKLPEEGLLLRVFIGESDRDPGGDRPLYEAIVRRAREAHLAGATVLKGPMGFGRHSRVHAARLWDLSTDLPIVIEIVDSETQVRAFLPVVDSLVSEGLVTLEAVRIIKYASPTPPAAPAS